MKYLQNLYISGFKSFSSENPQNFEFCGFGMNVVSGANGAGKSNVVDAILFALTFGESALRVQKMRHLVHSEGGKVDKCAVVELTFRLEDGDNVELTTVTAKVFSNSDERKYKILGKTKTTTEVRRYLSGTLGIDVKVPNFVVLQNSIISFMQKSGSELLSMITTVTGSAQMREVCTNLRQQMTEANTSQKELQLSMAGETLQLQSLKATFETLFEIKNLDKQLTEIELSLRTNSTIEIHLQREDIKDKTDQTEQLIKIKTAKHSEIFKTVEDIKRKSTAAISELEKLNKNIENTDDSLKETDCTVELISDDLIAAKASLNEAIQDQKQSQLKYQKSIKELQKLKGQWLSSEDTIRLLKTQLTGNKTYTKGEAALLRREARKTAEILSEKQNKVKTVEEEVARLTTKLNERAALIDTTETDNSFNASDAVAELRSIETKRSVLLSTIDDLKDSILRIECESSKYSRLHTQVGIGNLYSLLTLKPGTYFNFFFPFHVVLHSQLQEWNVGQQQSKQQFVIFALKYVPQ